MRSQCSNRRSFATARFACAALAVALAAGPVRGERIEIEELASSPVELTAPAARAVLVAGATTEIAWRPADGFAALAGATEWEAFLSVDGGRTYPVRLTPHLDLDRRRFAFRVPDLPSAEVRLLLRIGDERAERAVRLPTPLSIVRPVSPAPVALAAAIAVAPASAPGEPALTGGAGVLFWVEGDRDAANLRQHSATPTGARSASEPLLLAGGPEPIGSEDGDGQHFGRRPTAATHPVVARPPSAVVARTAAATAVDILLLIQRQNE